MVVIDAKTKWFGITKRINCWLKFTVDYNLRRSCCRYEGQYKY